MNYQRKIWISGLVLLSIFYVCIITASAEEFPSLYRGIRPLGMGNAFITVADDENTLFYNPAGLNDVKGFGGIEILNPLIEFSQVGLDAYSDFKDIDSNNVTEVTNVLSKYIGERFSLRTSLYPNIIFHNFGVGALGQVSFSGEVRNRVNPQVNVDGKADVGGVVGFAYGFREKKVQVGVALKFVQRQSFQKTYYATDIASANFDPSNDFSDLKKTGTGFSGDVGVKVNPEWPLRPSIGLVLQNIGDLNLDKAGKIPQQLNAGVSIHPDLWIFKNTLALDIVDLTKNVEGEDDFYKRVHMGAEIKLPYILSLRVGANQGYPSFGATIDFWILKLAYAYYKEELGAVAGQKDDARHVGQIAIGF
ncbi:MAG: conjugal transfer protein TraF [Nitrospirae bacterium]|nr:conjugal transfer protein TraF [Nitrospirota bacterium]